MTLFVWPDGRRPRCVDGISLRWGRVEWRRWPRTPEPYEQRLGRLARRMHRLQWIAGGFFIALAAVLIAIAWRAP